VSVSLASEASGALAIAQAFVDGSPPEGYDRVFQVAIPH
jgi:hypothetical protein